MTEETSSTEEKKSLSDQLKEDVAINDADIDGCMTEQASLYAYYSSMYAKAQYDANSSKLQADIARARAYKRLRSVFIAKGTKYTEALLEAEVMMDDLYQAALEKHNKYKWAESLAKEALEALKQRRDMLVQKGKSTLEERKGELYLRGVTEQKSFDERQADRRNRVTGTA